MSEAERLAEILEHDEAHFASRVTFREAAAELRRLKAECEQIHFELELCGQLKRGYQEQAAQAAAECEQLRKALQEIAWMRKPGVRVSRLVIAMEAAAVMALGKETK